MEFIWVQRFCNHTIDRHRYSVAKLVMHEHEQDKTSRLHRHFPACRPEPAYHGKTITSPVHGL